MAKPVSSRGTDQYQLRFPPGMRDKIKAVADSNGRSINSQIIAMLESCLAPNYDSLTGLDNLAKLPPDLVQQVFLLIEDINGLKKKTISVVESALENNNTYYPHS